MENGASRELLSVEAALRRISAAFEVLPAEQVTLPDALGRVLASDMAARLTQPPGPVSAMDGFAVRAMDTKKTPAALRQIGMSQAGRGFDGKVGVGQCIRIFTGAPIPIGADAIVIQENTVIDGDTITLDTSVEIGADIRPAGLDFSEGEVLLKAGKCMTARDLGLAAAMNIPWLMVRRRPRVAVMATGNELVMPGEPRSINQIISSNSIALEAYVKVLGGTPINVGIARDNETSLRDALLGAGGADILVTLGGASVGDFDLVRSVLGQNGLSLNFYKIAMRPGKPLIFGHLNNMAVLGLPGNPVSAGVTSVIFLRAAIAIMLGLDVNLLPDTAEAVLGRNLPANGTRKDFMRAKLSSGNHGQLVATPFERQDSAMMASFSEADCLVIRDQYAPAAKKGEPVFIVRLDIAAGAF
ncbi:MAG: molybdopterin molybdenumtransferase MoeA [Magnetovibrio sp.]|nr:molybdopterin molybdenumtransferase MoeA [Magnetovibrio sp.]